MKLIYPALLAVVSAAAVSGSTQRAEAQSCSMAAPIASLNFGSFSTGLPSPNPVSTTVSIRCTPASGLVGRSYFLVCPNIGGGAGGETAAKIRLMSGAGTLSYQLYSTYDTVVWGTTYWGSIFPPPSIFFDTANVLFPSPVALPPATLYAELLDTTANRTAPLGSYTSTYSAGHIDFRYHYASSRSGLPASCTTVSGTSFSSQPVFSVTASKVGGCIVSTTGVDFGTKGVLDVTTDAAGSIAATCTPGTAYSVSLGSGQNGTSATTRRMKSGSNFVSYGLFRDAGRSQVWGDVSGQVLTGQTGTGVAQNIPVYGRVPVQTTPPSGTYLDNVVVTLTY